MSLFDAEQPLTFPVEPAPQPPRRSNGLVIGGMVLLVASAVAVGTIAALPAPYVIEQPGPTWDVLGQVQFDGEQSSLIEIPGETTYPTEGSLRMLTVSVLGSPKQPPDRLQLLSAVLDPTVAVQDLEAVYPPGIDTEENAHLSQLEMLDSQQEAIAAAMHLLGEPVTTAVRIDSLQDESPAEGVLESGDVVYAINGEPVSDTDELRAAIRANGAERPASVDYLRGTEHRHGEITPMLVGEEDPVPVFGVFVVNDFTFPFTVNIRLENVGGPSAGMMFALGIVDKLTPGPLTGGQDVAGTGTITKDGVVGPIGGIRQKLIGAQRAGAEWFLAPADNCEEVLGHVPSGLEVFPVATLQDAMTVLAGIRSGDIEALPRCTPAGD